LAEVSTPTTPDKKGEKNEEKDNRERALQVRLSQEEFDAIERKFKNSGMKSKSAFVRAMIFEEHLVYFNENELREIHRLMNNAAFNINQIARRANSTNNVHKSDLDEIKESTEILTQLDLSEYSDKHPMALSGGQKQRTAIASGIASSKPIIIFDEPTSGLDLAHMNQVAGEILKLRDMGKTIFIVTHDPEFILSCCDHIVRLEEGRVSENYALDKDTVTGLLQFFAKN
jgi:ABC-type lipoprotein export system ATPase subunit